MSDATEKIKERWSEHLPEEMIESGIENQAILAIRETAEGWSIVTNVGRKVWIPRTVTPYEAPTAPPSVNENQPKTGPRVSFGRRRRRQRASHAK